MLDRAAERVLLTTDTVGGVWTFALTLARELSRGGAEVLLASMGGRPSEAQRAEAGGISNLRLEASGYKLEWMDDPWADVAASREWLRDLARDFAPDVVHLNSFGHAGLDLHAPVLLTVHSCVTSWWAAVKGEPLPPEWQRYRRMVQRAVRSADLITAPTRAMLDSVAENYGPGLPRAEVVPNGIAAQGFRPAAKEPFILAAGRLWDEAKNIGALAHVAPQLPWPVYLAGDGPEAEGCRSLGRVTTAELAGWYARAAIFAHPARYEPFGLAALEAALSGCALVLGDIASLREVWGDTALFVAPDDSRGLGAALHLLIERPDWREEMARRSRARAHSFSAGRMARTYAELYAALAGMRRMACSS